MEIRRPLEIVGKSFSADTILLLKARQLPKGLEICPYVTQLEICTPNKLVMLPLRGAASSESRVSFEKIFEQNLMKCY